MMTKEEVWFIFQYISELTKCPTSKESGNSEEMSRINRSFSVFDHRGLFFFVRFRSGSLSSVQHAETSRGPDRISFVISENL